MSHIYVVVNVQGYVIVGSGPQRFVSGKVITVSGGGNIIVRVLVSRMYLYL